MADGSGKPFFAYLPFTAPHWPLQAPPALIEKYKNRYLQGWEVLREQRLKGQRDQGVLMPNAELSAPATLASWDKLSPDEKQRQARAMAIYAAMIERLDWNVGRVLDLLRERGVLDNTVVVFFSDNGAEGATLKHTAEALAKAGHPGIAREFLKPVPLDEMGSAHSLVAYGPNWAQAVMAPRRLYKAVSTEGGISSPAIIRYPGFSRQGAVDNNLFTVMDIMPTLLEMAGAKHPDTYHGRHVEPLLGKSMLSYLDGAPGPVHGADEPIGWELFGQRALRQGQWKITYVSPPNGSGHWELYDLATDPGERKDLSAQHPDRLRAMTAHWDDYARRMGIILHEQVVSPYTSE
jgi:arylsulfatase